MKRFLSFVLRRIFVSLNRFQSIENEFLYAQGFGYDPGVKVEVRESLSLIRKISKDFSDLVVLDVGANEGDYTSAIIKEFPACSVHAFEPSPNVKEKLDQIFKDDHRVNTYDFGFSNKIGRFDLYSNDLNGKLSSLAKRNLDHINMDFDSVIEVSMTTLDSWCESKGVLPDILKIDVEGFEFQVLEGARRHLEKIRLIQFEFGGTDIDSRVFFRDFWQLLSDAGFEIYRLTPKGPKLITTYSERLEVFVFSNYFALNRNKI